MIKATTDSTRCTRARLRNRLIPAFVFLLATPMLPATAQSLMSAKDVMAAGDRVCTAGSNPVYGWYERNNGRFGSKEPGNSPCTATVPTILKLDVAGLKLPLAATVEYDLATAKVMAPLVEPAVCENYYTGNGGVSPWNLRIHDANDDDLFGSVTGAVAVDYALDSGTMTPRLVDTSVTWLRCHSGIAPNATLDDGVPDPGTIFADGFEAGADVRIEFLDAQTAQRIDDDVIAQSTQQNSSVTYTVRIVNVGNVEAKDVRVREFVPYSGLMDPAVDRLACSDVGGTASGPGISVALGKACDFSVVGPATLLAQINRLPAGQWRDFTVVRRSGSTDSSAGQAMGLIQVAAFTDPVNSPDANLDNNSRSLRIRMVQQITVTRAVSTAPSGVGGTIQRVSAPPLCGAELGVVTTCQPGATGNLVYSASANSGYTFTGFSGCSGSTSGQTTGGGTFTIVNPSATCTLTASFHAKPVVTAVVSGAHGSIGPASQIVDYNTQAGFTVTPDTGYEIDAISGCGGLQYDTGQAKWVTTNPVTADCEVSVSFRGITSTVTATAGAHGQIIGATSKDVQYPNQTVSFKVSADSLYQIDNIPGGNCPTGFWYNGDEYYINNVLGNCTVNFTFSQVTHPVTVVPHAHGTLQLDSATVVHGQSASFTIQPETGYHLDGAIGQTPACGTVTVTGNTGTAGPINSGGCVLTPSFAQNQYTVTVQLAAGEDGSNGLIGAWNDAQGDIAPVVIGNIVHGTSARFAVFPEAGFGIEINSSNVADCNFQFSLSDSDIPNGKYVYKANAVKADCTLEVGFTQ